MKKSARCADAAALGMIAVGVLALYGIPVLLAGRVYYSGDIARQYLPQWEELARALKQGLLPWWTAQLGVGYPLLAAGEVGALYPINWLLLALVSPEQAVNLFVVLHYLIAAAGCYVLARQLGISRQGGVLGALTLALGGFYTAHLGHLAVLGTAAWLPWLFAATMALYGPYPRETQDSRSPAAPVVDAQPGAGRTWLWAVALAVLVALQFVAGHAQVSLLGLLALGVYACILTWRARRPKCLLVWLAAVASGTLLALPQLLPSLQLAALSQRAGGLESTFFTSFSFHPLLTATFVSPFVLGNPYPDGSVELMGYVGLLPLALASVALWRWRHAGRQRRWDVLLFAGLGLAGWLLAFGRWNPLYRYLQLVPVLNLFRVPARYLYWTSLALAVLAALGYDALVAARSGRGRGRVWPLLAAAVLAAVAVGLVASAASVEALIDLWRWLPLLFAAAVLLLFAARGVGRRAWAAVAILVLVADLYAFQAVLARTYNVAWPREQVAREPAALAFLQQDESLYRIYTKEEILPTLSVQRESFYPSANLAYDLASANLYVPLMPDSYSRYLEDLDAERLNRLNAKYYLIPQLLPVDEASELYDVRDPYAALPLNRWIEMPAVTLSGLEVESYLSHSVGLTDGELAAEVVLRLASGDELVYPLRAGLETAEWAYERDDVRAQVEHSLPSVATTFPARSGFPARDHVGHTYRASWSFDVPLQVTGVYLRTAMPEAYVRIERVRLLDAFGGSQLLAHRVGLGDHSIVYRSEDVVVYRNEDVLPRAYLLAASLARLDADGNLALPEHLAATDVVPAQVQSYSNQRVVLEVQASQPAYLILADLAYPGWQARVDGQSAPILVADGLFRAVALAPGAHCVEFEYRYKVSLP